MGRTAASSSLDRTVAAVRTLFGAAACSVALVDESEAMLEYVAAAGEGAAEIVGVSLPVGRGIGGWAAMSGQPIAVRDVQSDARFARDVAESTHYVPSVILAAPLTSVAGEVLGVISVLDPGIEESSDWSLAVLGTLAAQAAMLLEQAGAPAVGDDDVATLGSEVLRVVDAWRDGGRQEPQA